MTNTQSNTEHAAASIDPAALWLCQLPGMTAPLMQQLRTHYGSAEAILRAPSKALREIGVAPGLVARMVAGTREVPRVAAGLKGYERLGIVPLPLLAPAYPDRLRELPNPPLVVYVQGQWPVTPPLAFAIAPAEIVPPAAQQWRDLIQATHSQVGIAALDPLIGGEVLPRLIGLPYGLMLTRQRVLANILKAVASGTTTLISIAAPNAPSSEVDPLLIATLLALADALVLLAPPPDDTLSEAARKRGLPAFLLDPKAPLPAGVRRLRTGKPGIRAFRAALGVHVAGAETARQERLF